MTSDKKESIIKPCFFIPLALLLAACTSPFDAAETAHELLRSADAVPVGVSQHLAVSERLEYGLNTQKHQKVYAKTWEAVDLYGNP